MTIDSPKSCSPDTHPETAVSLAEAARRVGVSRRTLQRALQAGTLRKQPDGRVALADLLALGYELGPGGKSSVLAVRLLEELTAAHARERTLLEQQYTAALQAQAAQQQEQQEVVATLTATVAALQTLVTQLGAAAPCPAAAAVAVPSEATTPRLAEAAMAVPSEPTPPATAPRRVALAGLASLLLLLL